MKGKQKHFPVKEGKSIRDIKDAKALHKDSRNFGFTLLPASPELKKVVGKHRIRS